VFVFRRRRTARSTLFPYTTLFRFPDVERALGIRAGGWAEQFKNWVSMGLGQGLSAAHKKALIEVLSKAQAENTGALETFSDRLLEFQDDPEADEDTRRGVRDYWGAVTPKSIREKAEAARAARGQPSGGVGRQARAAKDPSQMSELEYLVDAEAGINGLDAGAIMDVI